jgi:UDP:flavonoid glycosyltransferase YjiC (YdhE family)
MKTKKILFATAPFDGHFNPLTGLAVYLKNKGYDVRWYAQDMYAAKLWQLDIPHYPFVTPPQFNQLNMEEVFPERKRLKNPISKLNFDLQQIFIARGPEYYTDLLSIQKEFDFDLLVADFAFTGIPFVNHLMQKPIINMSIVPLTETSSDLPPTGLGMTPSDSFWGKTKQRGLRWLAKNVLFKKSMTFMEKVYSKYDIPVKRFLFDDIIDKSTWVLQSGTPSFEYKRKDISPQIRFVGPLLPAKSAKKRTYEFDLNKIKQYKHVILVTQGTVEKDIEKLLVPTLEAYKYDPQTLVFVTTGGSKTQELRNRYPQKHFIIDDYIPFDDVMPLCDVYVSNGGYGGVLLSIENEVPMVVAGVHEGKNEICARVGYFELGINLKTEKPKPEQIRRAVDTILNDKKYTLNTAKLAEEFRLYDTCALCEKYIEETLEKQEMDKLNGTKTMQFATV